MFTRLPELQCWLPWPDFPPPEAAGHRARAEWIECVARTHPPDSPTRGRFRR
jgi:hypothetical protein